jgi:FtsP/CotA-like multicopper oxidase with cupredoxin domain
MACARISGWNFLGVSADLGAGPMRGWKDTFGANPNRVSRIRRRFALPAGATVPQTCVYHRHMLEHEDNDMRCAPTRSSSSRSLVWQERYA